MKKLFLSSYLLGAFFTLNAQTISDIKNSSKRIDGRMGNSFYNHDIRQYKELNSMLNLNVFEYYELQKQYDTELKKKVFKDSDEYKMKFSELESKKLELKKTPYYLDFEPIYYERNNQIKYDLNTKSFSVTNEIYVDDLYNKPSCVQFDHIVFKNPNGIMINRKQFLAGGVDFIRQTIMFKIEDESLALKIEENRTNLRLLFVFKFTESIPFEGLDVFGRKEIKYALMNVLEKIILYNSSTSEIYYIYK